MKYVKVFIWFILLFQIGCSPSQRQTNISDKSYNPNCKVSQYASEQTQSIIWQALEDEDRSQTIGLKNEFNTYHFSKALSVEGKDFDIVVPRKYLSFSYDMYDRRINNSVPLLYVKILDDSTIQAELHTINKTNFREIHKLASDRNNNNTLADYPITEMEGCYTLTARKIENTSISVASEGTGWIDNPTQIEELFQNRNVYLTTSYNTYKSNTKPSTESSPYIEETSLYIDLMDISNNNRPNSNSIQARPFRV